MRSTCSWVTTRFLSWARKALGDFRDLARRAAAVERETGVDAGAIIFSWARTTGDYAKATMAIKALYLSAGAARRLSEYFETFVNVEGAPLSDQELMRTVVSKPSLSSDASAG